MSEYVNLFRQVVAQFDSLSRPDAMMPVKRTNHDAIGPQQGVACPGQLWGYAIIQFSKRMQRYEDQVRIRVGQAGDKASSRM